MGVRRRPLPLVDVAMGVVWKLRATTAALSEVGDGDAHMVGASNARQSVATPPSSSDSGLPGVRASKLAGIFIGGVIRGIIRPRVSKNAARTAT